MKKCPSSIKCWDSNPRPLERESLPITTRPGLLFLIIAFQIMKLDQFVWEFTAKMWPRLQVPNLGIYKVLWNSPLVNSGNFAYSFCWTWIAHKGRLYSRMSFIYKYKTSTFTPFVKPCNMLNLAVWNIFYVQSYVESAFTFNPGSTIHLQQPILWKECNLKKFASYLSHLKLGYCKNFKSANGTRHFPLTLCCQLYFKKIFCIGPITLCHHPVLVTFP